MEMKSDRMIGPKMNPSGPKKITPPRIEKRTKIGGASSPLPKKYAESMLSIKSIIMTPNKPMPIAPNMLPDKSR